MTTLEIEKRLEEIERNRAAYNYIDEFDISELLQIARQLLKDRDEATKEARRFALKQAREIIHAEAVQTDRGMTKKIEYQYAVLQYRHGIVTGEVLNCGVALQMNGGAFVRFLWQKDCTRFESAFNDFNHIFYLAYLARLEAAFEAREFDGEGFEYALSRILPVDDSAYQFGCFGSGLTDDPEAELKRLFERFVTKYSR